MPRAILELAWSRETSAPCRGDRLLRAELQASAELRSALENPLVSTTAKRRHPHDRGQSPRQTAERNTLLLLNDRRRMRIIPRSRSTQEKTDLERGVCARW